ncbi:MAG: sugar ABC transporter substrate-binding protein [Geminicoccaceae bacterium]|nr:sugar ABC transporter substrate-binding protein [Geminicoccaceae bacterium]
MSRLLMPDIRRRSLVKAGIASALFPMPFVSRARAQSGPMKFWQFTAPGGSNPARVKWFTDLVDAWNADHEIKVELEYIPVAQYLNGTKLQTAFAAGEGPDIFVISPGDFLRYYNGGVLMDLAPFMSDEAKADFYDSAMATRVVDGGIFGMPMEIEPMAMYYNKAMFAEAGIGEDQLPTTWDGLIELAREFTTAERYGVLFSTEPGYYQNFTWYPFLWQGGGEITDFNSDAAVQALGFWKRAIDEGVAPRKALGYGANDPVANIGSGFCAMQNVGIWGVSALRDNAPDLDYGVFRLPLPPGGEYTTDLGGWAFVANSQGPTPEAAAEFCVWALGTMEDESIERMVEWCTVAKSDLAPRRSAQERAVANGFFDEGVMKVFLEEIFPGGRGEPRVPPQVYKAVSDAIQACQLGGADPAEQAAQAGKQIEAFLAGYTGAPIV